MNSGRTVQLVGILLSIGIGEAIAFAGPSGRAHEGLGDHGATSPGVVAQARATGSAAPSIDDRCAALDDPARRTAADLRCVRLLPTPTGGQASGMAELGRVSSPFGVALTPDGRQRYRLTLSLVDAPAPSALGSYRELVAWAVSPRLDAWINLGPVRNGVNRLGEVALNKFTLMVTAEADASGTEQTSVCSGDS